MKARDVLRALSGGRARTAGSLLQGIRGNGVLLFGSTRSIVRRALGPRTTGGVGVELTTHRVKRGSMFRLGFPSRVDASAR